MNEQETIELLHSKLSSYLTNDDKKYDSTQMINSIISTIIQYFECDKIKLAEALDNLIQMKNDERYVKFADKKNKFDISMSTKLSVKGFLSKGQPILFFYLGDDVNPYAIVKTSSEGGIDTYSVEISNNSQVLATYKKDDKFKGDEFVIVEEYKYFLDKCSTTRNVYAKTNLKNSADSMDIQGLNDIDDEYANFFKLLVNAMTSSKLNFSKISGFGMDILFLSFYDTLLKLSAQERDFKMQDVIYLINDIVYKNMLSSTPPNSLLASAVDSIPTALYAENHKKTPFLMDVNGQTVQYDIVKSENYLSIDAVDDGKKKGSIMIIGTSDGFSFYRTYAKSGYAQGEEIPTPYVINFSKGKLKVVTIGDDAKKNKLGTHVEMVLNVSKNGEMKLGSTHSVTTPMIEKETLVESKSVQRPQPAVMMM